MNWKLIFGLSAFGLAMALATVSVVPSDAEPVFWLLIFIVCAFLIARACSTRHFAHGLMVGIVNSAWVTGAHLIFFSQYIAHHPKQAQMMTSAPLASSPRLAMALTGPIVGVVSGFVLGVFAWVAGKFIKPQVANAI